jgi:hypothetical protein
MNLHDLVRTPHRCGMRLHGVVTPDKQARRTFQGVAMDRRQPLPRAASPDAAPLANRTAPCDTAPVEGPAVEQRSPRRRAAVGTVRTEPQSRSIVFWTWCTGSQPHRRAC